MPKIKNKNIQTATYAVDGMTEYVLRIPVANTHVDLNFTGGLFSGYGVRPATLTLDDPIKIRLLESTQQFRSGFIRKLY